MANHFDGPVGIDDITATSYFAWLWDATTQAFIGPRIIPITVNPTAGAGLAAPLGSIATRYDAGQVSIWQKTTAPDTGWVNVGTISGGALFPTSIDTTGTAAFQWTMADNQAAAVSFGAAGALNMLVFDTTNNAEQVQINAADGLRLADGSPLEFGTPGTDVVFTPDGTGVLVTGTGTIDFATDFQLRFGTGNQWLIERDGTGDLLISGPISADVDGDGLLLATAIVTSATGARISGGLSMQTGSTTSNGNAAGDSGAIDVTTGDALDTGGQGSGSSGPITVETGSSADVNTGIITLITGNAAAGNSGNVVITTGTAAGVRGVLDINVATVDFATQASSFLLADNQANALRIVEGAGTPYVNVSTANGAERVTLGAAATTTLNGVYTTFNSNDIETSGIDHGTRYLLTEEFTQRPEVNASVANATANKSFELLVGALTANAPSSALMTQGGTQITTAAVAVNDGAACRPHLDADQSAWQQTTWSSGLAIITKFTIRTFENTDVRYEIGVRGNPAALDDGTDNEKFMLRFDTTDGVTSAVNWVLVSSNAGADTLTDTTVAAAANASLNMYFRVDSATRQVSAYIGRTLAANPALHVLAAGVDVGKPYVAVASRVGGGGTRRIGIRRISASMIAA